MKIEITIPVLNEEKTLKINVEKTLSFIKDNLSSDCSICIADNGSTDGTARIAKEMISTYDNIRFVQVPSRGVGIALQTSWKDSTADIIGYMDLDLATKLDHLKEVEQLFIKNECDILYGTRLHEKSTVQGRKIIRSIVSRVFNTLMKLYFNIKISDSMCGFKFLKREKLPEINRYSTLTSGWFYCAELLVISERIKLKIIELPVIWTDDPNSKVNLVKLSLQYLKEMTKLKQRINK